MRWLFGLLGDDVLIFAACYPVVLTATLIAGLRCGIVSLLLSTLLFSWAFVPPPYSFALSSLVDGANVAFYVITGATLVWIGHLYREAVRRLTAEKSKNELLVRELGHRSKNGLAVISSIVTQSLRHDPEGSKKIIGRIAALKQGEEIMLAAESTPVSVRDLLARELSVYDANRLALSGPAMMVAGDVAKTLCMVVHELATNCIKYGALSTTDGKIILTWEFGPTLAFLRWTEDGVRRPVTVGKAGFGTFLVERLIAQHNGEAEMEYGPRGITWNITFPAQQPPVTEAVCAAILQDQTHSR